MVCYINIALSMIKMIKYASFIGFFVKYDEFWVWFAEKKVLNANSKKKNKFEVLGYIHRHFLVYVLLTWRM